MRLPNIVKKWFAANPNPKKTWDKDKVRSKSNNLKQKACTQAFIDAIVSNGVTVVIESTDNPQSQMSTASQH